MDAGFVQSLLDLVAQHHTGIGPVVLFLSSLIEYVFPPFPGDVITLFGTYLVVKGLWSFGFAMFLTTAGSLVGALLDYYLGVYLSSRSHKLPSEKDKTGFSFLTQEKFQLLTSRFRRYGAVYISFNRFLPGIRAFFFVAAGASRMGLEHGAYCVGCCAVLMLLLFVGGVMNLIWIAGLSVFVALEKLAPFGVGLARALSIILIAGGAALIIAA